MNELLWQKNNRILNKVKLFDKFSNSFVRKLYVLFKEELLGQNDQILEEDGELVVRQEDRLVYLISGKVKFYNCRTNTNLKIVKTPTMLGEIEFFSECKNVCSVVSLDFCSIL